MYLYFLVSHNNAEIHRDCIFSLNPLCLIIYLDFNVRYFQPLEENAKIGVRKEFARDE